MKFGDHSGATFVCPYCERTQTVSRGRWEFVHAQVLMHFSSCAPPNSVHLTADVMETAARITNTIVKNQEG